MSTSANTRSVAMGMFDYIKCEMPLPGKVPTATLGQFQTKDTPEQYMETYTIAADGSLSGPDVDGFTGSIRFYATNSTGGHLGMSYSRNGEDVESVEYLATVVNGRVTDIQQTEYSIEPGVRPEPESVSAPTPDEAAERRAKEQSLRVGREVYMLWGTSRKGYRAVIVAEDESKHRKELCIKAMEDDDSPLHHSGRLEIVSRWQLGSTLYLSEADALQDRAEREAKLDELREKYAAIRKAWYSARGEEVPK